MIEAENASYLIKRMYELLGVALGERVSRKTVAVSLRRRGLAGISPRRFAATTVADLDAVRPKDLVRRRFDTGMLTNCGAPTLCAARRCLTEWR